MAHLTAIFRPSCVKCEELAEYELRTSRNEMKGNFCSTHGKAALSRVHAEELASSPRGASDSKPPGRMVGADRGAPGSTPAVPEMPQIAGIRTADVGKNTENVTAPGSAPAARMVGMDRGGR